jgi:hypothetical protein
MQTWHGEKKSLQENWDPGELWAPKESDRNRQEVDPLYRSGMAQGESADELRGQKRTGGPRRQTAAMFEKRKYIQLAPQEDHRQREDREVKSRILRRVAEYQTLSLVEQSTPSKTEKLHIEEEPVM